MWEWRRPAESGAAGNYCEVGVFRLCKQSGLGIIARYEEQRPHAPPNHPDHAFLGTIRLGGLHPSAGAS